MRKKLFVSAFCLILVFSFAGCKKKAAEPKVETIGDITYIHNLSTPLHPNKTVAFEEEFTFREKDASGEIRLFKPGRYAVDEKDNAYISDESDMAIKVFDSEGRYLRTLGRSGKGPGEFESIGDTTFLPDGRLLVTDYQTRRTSFFSPEGQFLSSFQWKKSYGQVLLAANDFYTVSENY